LIAVRYIFPKKIEKRLVQEQWDWNQPYDLELQRQRCIT
jgi:hypothetical protein